MGESIRIITATLTTTIADTFSAARRAAATAPPPTAATLRWRKHIEMAVRREIGHIRYRLTLSLNANLSCLITVKAHQDTPLNHVEEAQEALRVSFPTPHQLQHFQCHHHYQAPFAHLVYEHHLPLPPLPPSLQLLPLLPLQLLPLLLHTQPLPLRSPPCHMNRAQYVLQLRQT
ncbi:olfactory receptor 1571 [Striga asiatica]|uniref:Olfactory receptor 1571 n=1 Tax=Striga asiatica TaxID=4170 RepID=A0A5A7QHU3_STRAF|nr:olfactory receptor 1571 [Striga asiatica]